MCTVYFKAFALCCTLLCAGQTYGVNVLYGQGTEDIQDVVLYPLMNDTFVCAEHAEGELGGLGDALGKDCMVIRMDTTRMPDRRIPSLFQGDGLKNEDWFGWETALLAPCDGVVMSAQANPVTNRPGELPGAKVQPASDIVFVCQDDHVHVIYAHARDIQVQPGDSVAAGETVAKIGNNAVSRAPHVHVGAWKDETPLQIRFDLSILGKLRRSH